MSTNPFAPRPPSPRAAAKIAASEESAANLRKILKPEAAAARLGFDSLAEIEAQIPERLRPHIATVISRGSFTISEVGRMTDGAGNPATRSMLIGRITEKCQMLDQAAAAGANETARRNARTTCEVLGQTDHTTHRRRMPWGNVLLLSDVGEAALLRAWSDSFPDTIMDAARSLLPDSTELEQAPPPRRRKSA